MNDSFGNVVVKDSSGNIVLTETDDMQNIHVTIETNLNNKKVGSYYYRYIVKIDMVTRRYTNT